MDIANQLIHPLALLLWVAAVLAWVAVTPILSWAILAVIVVNAMVAFLQEQQATRAVEAMEGYLPARARVLRDGRPQMVPAEQVVPGDVLVVAEGDLVCADARLLDGFVEIDMSALTGESAPVRRSAGTIDRADRLIEAPDAVFSGSTCVQGRARAVVFATASHTELGRIAALSQRMVDCQELDLTADPMERALRECGEQLGHRPAPPEVVFGFEPRRKRMSVVVRRDGRLVVQTKGAREMVVPLCTSWSTGDGAEPLAPADRAAVLRAVDEGAARGLRILALASRPAPTLPPDADRAETDLRLLGLVALEDPPRPEVRAAVAKCHRAGLRIHVVTGNHAATATAIARRVGISAGRVVGDAEIDRMSDEELGRLLAQAGEFVIARSTPEGKLRIAETLDGAARSWR